MSLDTPRFRYEGIQKFADDFYKYEITSKKKLSEQQINEIASKQILENLDPSKGIKVIIQKIDKQTAVLQPKIRLEQSRNTLWERVINFIGSFFTKPKDPAQEARLQISFIQQLFGTGGSDIVEKLALNNPDTSLSFSKMISFWKDVYVGYSNDEGAAGIQELYEYQKSIESLRNLAKPVQEKRAQDVKNEILGSLRDKSSVLMPGGYFDANNNSAFPLVYQIKKNEDETYTITVCNPTSAKAGENMTLTVENIEEFVEKALKLQIGTKSKVQKLGVADLALEGLKLMFGKDSDAIEEAKIDHKKEFELLFQNAQNKVDLPDNASEFKTATISLKNLSRLLIKDEGAVMTMFKGAQFAKAWQLAKQHNVLNDPAIQTWFQETGVQLAASLQKLEAKQENQELQADAKAIHNMLQTVFTELKAMKSKPLKPTPIARTSASYSFSTPGALSSPINPPREIQAEKAALQVRLASIGTQNPTVEQLAQDLKTCQTLADRGDFLTLDCSLRTLFAHLQKVGTSDLTDQQDIGRVLHELAFLIPRACWGQGYTAPLSYHIKDMLFAFSTIDTIFRSKVTNREAKEVCEKFHFEFNHVRKILDSRYLTFGEDAEQIEKYMPKAKSQNSIPFTGVEAGYGNNEDYRFWTTMKDSISEINETWPHDIDGPLRTKSGAIIFPEEFNQARQISILLQTFIAPSRMLTVRTLSDNILTGMEIQKSGVSSVGDLLRGGFVGAARLTQQKMKACSAPLRLNFAKGNAYFGVDSFVLEPLGMALTHLDQIIYLGDLGNNKFTNEIQETYDKNGVQIPQDIQIHCFDQVVSKGFENPIDADEKALDGFDEQGGQTTQHNPEAPYRDRHLHGETPLEISSSTKTIAGLSLERSRKIQLILTAPASRIKETLGLLESDPSLLEESATGPALFRLFFSILTHPENLKHLKDSPEFVTSALERLTTQARKGNLERLAVLTQELVDVYASQKLFGITPKECLLERSTLSTYEHLQAKLLHAAHKPNPDLAEVLENYFAFKNEVPNEAEFDPEKALRIEHFLFSLREKNVEYLEKTPSFFKKLGLSESGWKRIPETGRFKNGDVVLDAFSGTIWKNNTRTSKLPYGLSKQPFMDKLQTLAKTTENLAQTDWTVSEIEAGNTRGLSFSIKYKTSTGESAQLKIATLSDGSTTLYRKINPGSWQIYYPQLLSNTQEQEGTPPRLLNDYDCWLDVSGKKAFFEREGLVCITGATQLSSDKSSLHIDSLYDQTAKQYILNPWDKKEYSPFRSMEDTSQISCYGEKNKPSLVSYHRMPLSYSWNEKKTCWECNEQLGFHLSEKHPSTIEKIQGMFKNDFSTYQLLENGKGKQKLLLPHVEFGHRSDKESYQVRHRMGQEPLWKATKPQLPLYTYDIDPVKGIIPNKTPEGYLYLAYTLICQNNFKDAAAFLKKAPLSRKHSAEGQEISKWIIERLRGSPTPDANALLLKFTIQQMELHDLTQQKAGYAHNYQLLLGLLDETSTKYETNKNAVRPELKLKKRELEACSRLQAQNLKALFAIAKQQKENIVSVSKSLQTIQKLYEEPEGDTTDDIRKKLEAIQNLQASPQYIALKKELLDPFRISFRELKEWHETGLLDELISEEETDDQKILAFEQKTLTRLAGSLEEEVRLLKEKMEEKRPETQETSLCTPSSPILECFKDFSTEQRGIASMPILSSIKNETYSDEILNSLIDDTEKAHRQKADTFDKISYDPKTVLKSVRNEKEALQTWVYNQRKIIEHAARSLIKSGSKGEATLTQQLFELAKNEGVTSDEALFSTLLHMYGEDDWELIPDDEQGRVPQLKELIGEFLHKAVALQHVERVEEAILAHQNAIGTDKETLKMQELATLVTTHWQYEYPGEHSLIPAVQLIEYELGFPLRKSQLEVVDETLKTSNLFKQEICGGGKTTVLRNLIAKARADGSTLSCVCSLEPLQEEHGKILQKTTLQAFGEGVFEFHFDAKSPTDSASLLKLEKRLCQTIVEQGRVDHTEKDVSHLLNTWRDKRELVSKLREQIATAPEEEQASLKGQIENAEKAQAVLERIISLFRSRGVSMADEGDETFRADKTHNLSYGEELPLNNYQRDGACTLFQTIASSQDPAIVVIRKAIQSNKQKDLSDTAITEAQHALAHSIAKTRSQLSEEEICTYLLGGDSSDATYEKLVQLLKETKDDTVKAEIQQLMFQRQFISDILPFSIKKTGGVSYGKSEDGISVIPYSGSDRPSEGSEHSLSAERLWYTYMEYLDSSRGGITTDLISQQVQEAKVAATRQQLDSEIEISLDETPAGMLFFQQYGSKLSRIDEAEVDKIAQQLNASPEKQVAFVRDIVIRTYKSRTKKIESDAQDVAWLFKEFSASSGTELSQHAMPDKIDATNPRQPGVHGQILIALDESAIKTGSDTWISLGEGQSTEEVLAQQMKGGDCLSDVGRHFPGISADTIAERLYNALPDKTLVIRFMDRNNRWLMYTEGRVVPLDPNITADKVITLFDDVHTRGAERPSMDGVVEFVTISNDTDLTRFEQAVLRERGVTKGKATVRYIIAHGLDIQKLDTLKKHICDNEAERLKQLNLKKEIQCIRHIPRGAVEEGLLQISNVLQTIDLPSDVQKKAQSALHALTKRLYITGNEIDALEAGRPKKSVNTAAYLSELQQKQIDLMKDFQAQLQQEEFQNVFEPVSAEQFEMSVNNALSALKKIGLPITQEMMIPSLQPINQLFRKDYANDLMSVKKQIQSQFSTAVMAGIDMNKLQEIANAIVLKPLTHSLNEALQRGIKALTERKPLDAQYLPGTVSSAAGLGQEQHVEQQVEQEVEQEVEQQTESSGKKRKNPIESAPWRDFEISIDKNIFTRGNANSIAPWEKKNKIISINLCPHPWSYVDEKGALPGAQGIISRSLFFIDLASQQVLEFVGSQIDIQEQFEGKKSLDETQMLIYNYNSGRFDTGKVPENAVILKEIHELQVTTMLRNGQTSFPPPLDQVLRDYLKQQTTDVKRLEESFKTVVRDYRQGSYEGSDAQKIFREALGR